MFIASDGTAGWLRIDSMCSNFGSGLCCASYELERKCLLQFSCTIKLQRANYPMNPPKLRSKRIELITLKCFHCWNGERINTTLLYRRKPKLEEARNIVWLSQKKKASRLLRVPWKMFISQLKLRHIRVEHYIHIN